MFRVSRRSIVIVSALATVLLAGPGGAAAAEPGPPTSAHTVPAGRGVDVTLGAASHPDSGHVRPAGLQLHGSGLHPPATDTAPTPLDTGDPAMHVGLSPSTWMLLFVASLLGSLRYVERRLRR
jgi:hypothetical protein